MLRKQAVVDLMPGLLAEAQRRAQGESDNLSVVAMTWENQDDPSVADTQSMDDEQFAHLHQHHAAAGHRRARRDDVTDEDIERAIAEIQNAIKKVPR